MCPHMVIVHRIAIITVHMSVMIGIAIADITLPAVVVWKIAQRRAPVRG